MNKEFSRKRHHRYRGLSLPELMVSLAISAALLVATMVAVDTSFRAYSQAAKQASTQAASRMVINRLLTLVRTGTAHGPLLPDGLATPPVTLNGNMITSNFIELVGPNNDLLRIEYRSAVQQLWLITTPAGGGAAASQPLLGGVTDAQFFATRRLNDDGLWVLERGTVDLTVEPDDNAALSADHGMKEPIRIVASTKPRKIL